MKNCNDNHEGVAAGVGVMLSYGFKSRLMLYMAIFHRNIGCACLYENRHCETE